MNLETIGLICLLVGAVITEVRRSWQHGEFSMSKTSARSLGKRVLSWSPTILMLVGATLYFGHQWTEKVGFVAGWPDAITCKVPEPFSSEEKHPSLVYYFEGIAPRGKQGDVAIYMRAGWFNTEFPTDLSAITRPPSGWGYLTHELWFSSGSGKFLSKDQLGDGAHEGDFEKLYRLSLAGDKPDCGGLDMGSIKKSGNAFTFARPFK